MFDISDPCDALNLAVFLFRLSRVYVPKLKQWMQKGCEDIFGGDKKIPEWAQEHQRSTSKNQSNAKRASFHSGMTSGLNQLAENEDEDDEDSEEGSNLYPD